ncbi:MAG TPA: response regulator [Ignavibacteria bacterium]|jgi:DNA-binding NtrC family response regulator
MKKILIIDDNKYLRFTLSTLVEESGYKAIEAGDKEKAIKMLKSKKPNLIILDKRLPDCDGFDLLKEIKNLDGNIPVIMLTAYAENSSAGRAIDLGAYAFMTKPFDNTEMVSTIKKALKRN